MNTIELEERTAQEVFEELKCRLEDMGYLPDEYFLLAPEWENGREIPQDADIFCTTGYGGSEGIYLDVYLRWYEGGTHINKNFITGKTLGETGADLDRMFLISSAITKAFRGDHGTYARYLRLDEQPEPEDMIVHLNPAEQRTIIQALVEQRERQENAMSQTEQLLRRMTGSITAYMDEVGRYPPVSYTHLVYRLGLQPACWFLWQLFCRDGEHGRRALRDELGTCLLYTSGGRSADLPTRPGAQDHPDSHRG